MIVDLWVTILPIVYYDLLVMDCNIYGFTTLTSKLSLPIKKSQQIGSKHDFFSPNERVVWFLECNLTLYRYKLYNLNI
jgi:hypothetical protein